MAYSEMCEVVLHIDGNAVWTFEVYDLCRSNDLTLRKDCRCACHAAPNAVIHVHPCCGPGSVGWPPENVLPSEGTPTKPSLFSEMTREINLRMVLLSTNPGTRNPERREIGEVVLHIGGNALWSCDD